MCTKNWGALSDRDSTAKPHRYYSHQRKKNSWITYPSISYKNIQLCYNLMGLPVYMQPVVCSTWLFLFNNHIFSSLYWKPSFLDLLCDPCPTEEVLLKVFLTGSKEDKHLKNTSIWNLGLAGRHYFIKSKMVNLAVGRWGIVCDKGLGVVFLDVVTCMFDLGKNILLLGEMKKNFPKWKTNLSPWHSYLGYSLWWLQT